MKFYAFLGTLLLTYSVSAQKFWNNTAGFDGKSYLAVSESVLKESRKSITVEFWLKPELDSASETVCFNTQFYILLEKGKMRWGGNTVKSFFSKKLIKGGTWTHCAVSMDGDKDSVRIYLNGVLDTATKETASFLSVTDSMNTGFKYYNKFKGEIDEFRVWRVARSASEIKNTFKTHIANWNLDEIYNYGELAYVQSYESKYSDSGFSVPNSKITGKITSIPTGLKPNKIVRHNNSLLFSGGSFSYLEATTSNHPDLSITKELTFEAWVNPSAFDTRMVIVDLTGGGGGFQLATIYDGKLNLGISNYGTTTSLGLAPNTWYHIAVVIDSSDITTSRSRIYVNGKLINTASHYQLTANAGKLRLGASLSNGDYFKGFMDEVRISNWAKSEAEILENMYNPIHKFNQPTMPKYTVAYNFDGGYFSSTGKGPDLENFNQTCRFTYFNEPIAPMFCLGSAHNKTMSKFTRVQRAAFVPAAGNTQGVVSDTMVFNKAVKIDPKSFKVFLAIAHAKISDLKIELIAPSGESVTLINQINSISGNQITLVIDTTQSYKITDAAFVDHAPLIGFNGTFNAFNGVNSKGVWTLKVSDLVLGYTGRLYSWGIYADGEAIQTNGLKNQTLPTAVAYPNPVKAGQNLTFKSTQHSIGFTHAEILNQLGQIVQSTPVNSNGGNLVLFIRPDLAEGWYVVRLMNQNSSTTCKIRIEN